VSFSSFADFIAMDGHGIYVWLAYGIAFFIFLFNLILPLMNRKELLTNLARRLRRERASS